MPLIGLAVADWGIHKPSCLHDQAFDLGLLREDKPSHPIALSAEYDVPVCFDGRGVEGSLDLRVEDVKTDLAQVVCFVVEELLAGGGSETDDPERISFRALLREYQDLVKQHGVDLVNKNDGVLSVGQLELLLGGDVKFDLAIVGIANVLDLEPVVLHLLLVVVDHLKVVLLARLSLQVLTQGRDDSDHHSALALAGGDRVDQAKGVLLYLPRGVHGNS